MGAIFSPIYANLSIGYLEEFILPTKCNNNHIFNYIQSKFKRYLDDCFIILNISIITPENLLILFNSLNINIKFTLNKNSHSISFLDILIIKDNTNIETDIYYKKTNNHLYLNFKSFHPRHIKRNIPTLFLIELIE